MEKPESPGTEGEAQSRPGREVPGIPGLEDPAEVTSGGTGLGRQVHPVWFAGWMASDILHGNAREAGVPGCPWDISKVI